MLKIIQGDLFKSKDSIAHCISAYFAMGAGVALEVRKRWINKFPASFVYPPNDTQDNSGLVGSCIPVKINDDRYIFNLITKQFYWSKPTYVSLKWSLAYMFDIAPKFKVTKIAMPRIGCGLDQLSWLEVRLILKEFCNKNPAMDITVYELEKK